MSIVLLDSCQRLLDDSVFNAAYESLSESRQNRCKKENIGNNRQHVLAGVLLEEYLIKQGIDAIEYGENEVGKPILLDNESIDFSITHSANYVGVAVSHDGAVGIDLEARPMPSRRKSNLDSIIDSRFVSEKEREFIKADASKIEERFLRIWTFKEAYVKASGVALANVLMNVDAVDIISRMEECEETFFTSPIECGDDCINYRTISTIVDKEYIIMQKVSSNMIISLIEKRKNGV